MLARSGISAARERIDWPALNRRPGEWDWDAVGRGRPGGYDRLRQIYAREGIPVLAVLAARRAGLESPVHLPFAPVAIRGIDGRQLPLQGHDAPMADGLIYVVARRDRVANLLTSHTGAAELLAVSQQPRAPLPKPSAILLQPRIDLAQHPASQLGYHLSAGAQRIALPVRIHNFSDSPEAVVIEMSVGRTREHSMETRKVATPANGHADVTFALDTSRLQAGDGVALTTLRLRDTRGRPLDTVALNWILPWGPQEHLARFDRVSPLPIADPDRWRAGSMSPAVSEPRCRINGDGRVELRATFHAVRQAVAQWVFEVPHPPEFTQAGAIVVHLRHERPASVRLRVWTDFDTSHLARNRLTRGDGGWMTMVFPLDAATFYTFEDLTPEQAARFHAGLGVPRRIAFLLEHAGKVGEQNRLEIGGVWLAGSKPSF